MRNELLSSQIREMGHVTPYLQIRTLSAGLAIPTNLANMLDRLACANLSDELKGRE